MVARAVGLAGKDGDDSPTRSGRCARPRMSLGCTQEGITAVSALPHYALVIAWSEEDRAYLVTLPEWAARAHMPIAHGSTYQEAALRGQHPLESLIEQAALTFFTSGVTLMIDSSTFLPHQTVPGDPERILVSTTLQDSVERDTQQLTRAIGDVLALAPGGIPAMRAVLHGAVAQLEEIVRTRAAAGAGGAPSDELLRHYFPLQDSPRRDIATAQLQAADAGWQDARQRGRRYRDQARAEIGELITPGEVALRLGVSRATVATWRAQRKLLGVRFDDHQYLYPAFQFVTSPEHGERGVLRHLDTVLAALGDRSPWWKARFLRTPAGALDGRTPLDVLLASEPLAAGLDRLLLLAHRSGELGN